MKSFLEKTRSFLVSFGSRFKRKPKASTGTPATSEPSTTPRKRGGVDRFTLISWVVTGIIVASLLGSTILYKNANASSANLPPQATQEASVQQPIAGGPMSGSDGNAFSAIMRDLKLKTDIPERERVEPVTYRV
jgi:hypothetical protein